MNKNFVKIFLRITISLGFLSAVADRFGMWNKEVSAWGNWDNFLQYTELINPWFPISIISTIGIIATSAEIVFAIKPYSNVKFENIGIINNNCRVAIAMGNYYFTMDDGSDVKVEYTFAYVKDKNGKLRIAAHQSSLPYSPN